MSDFSQLLHQLKGKAEEAKQHTSSKKRKRSNNNNGEVSEASQRNYPNPKDIAELGGFKLHFLCIGAQKAGTTWLHEMLSRHTNIVLPSEKKEIHFWDWNREKGLGWYKEQFRFRPKMNKIFGEINPCYAVLSERDICEIHTLFPDIKIIFIARNITERTVSAIAMEWHQNLLNLAPGQFIEDNNGSSAITDNDKDTVQSKLDDEYVISRMHHITHTSRSDYAICLRNWLKYFGRDQLLIVNYADIATNPACVLADVCKHIGVNPDKDLFTAHDLSRKVNVGKFSASQMNGKIMEKVQEFASSKVESFNDLLAELGYEWKLQN
mmetsp:Transcript_5197/g.7727  ORF Transcript_5197/g.7727 Transcript_5197/m.7727 type:complete len:323 (-) Transcript_5197:436-1404(-)|eukprot:CAMPEP_0196818340 /NCGR_PEP_ID=MMETSP1362-20130617/65121_1 /TAXON_ID=163516 /ORGANISM="Leptocylindrus danicus, Strain CCMP1856" /LENGTH=322 /DNA_ID=CAMNT_0042196403 /DNA_START=316 /DNA_END=1284 /DNA_ORIENTATION=+